MIRVIGCGNLLAYDEGMGIHAVRELKQVVSRSGVELLELRRPGLLLHELVYGTNKLILIDAMATGRTAGLFDRFELTGKDGSLNMLKLTVHGFNLLPIFERGLNSRDERLPQSAILFAMEIAERHTFHVGLSAPVREALPLLVKAVSAEIHAL
jgi:hydrogenase maturation protease